MIHDDDDYEADRDYCEGWKEDSHGRAICIVVSVLVLIVVIWAFLG